MSEFLKHLLLSMWIEQMMVNQKKGDFSREVMEK